MKKNVSGNHSKCETRALLCIGDRYIEHTKYSKYLMIVFFLFIDKLMLNEFFSNPISLRSIPNIYKVKHLKKKKEKKRQTSSKQIIQLLSNAHKNEPFSWSPKRSFAYA